MTKGREDVVMNVTGARGNIIGCVYVGPARVKGHYDIIYTPRVGRSKSQRNSTELMNTLEKEGVSSAEKKRLFSFVSKRLAEEKRR